MSDKTLLLANSIDKTETLTARLPAFLLAFNDAIYNPGTEG